MVEPREWVQSMNHERPATCLASSRKRRNSPVSKPSDAVKFSDSEPVTYMWQSRDRADVRDPGSPVALHVRARSVVGPGMRRADDSQAQVGCVSALFTEGGPANSQAAEPGNVQDTSSRGKARARGPVLQTARMTKAPIGHQGHEEERLKPFVSFVSFVSFVARSSWPGLRGLRG